MNVVVIGSGLAGLTSAIKTSDLGANVTLISPTFSESSQSVMAMGGELMLHLTPKVKMIQ